MTAIPRGFLPQPAAEARQGLPAAPGTGEAWQLEMEKAQTRQWFHGTVPQGGGALLPGQAGAADGRDMPASRLAPQSEDASARARAAQPGAQAAAEVQPPRAWMPASFAPAAASGGLPLVAGVAAPHGIVSSPRTIPPAPTPALMAAGLPARDTDAVRVHVEEGPQGLRVWLGIAGDADAAIAQAHAVLADLRRGFGGRRIAQVVCNGTTIFRHDPQGGEPAAPAPFLPLFHHSQEP